VHRAKLQSRSDVSVVDGHSTPCCSQEIAFQIDNLRERLNNMMPQLLRMEELENGVDITSNLMSREYGLLCKQSGYRQGKYSSAVMQGCLLVLQSNEFQVVDRFF